MVGLSTEGVKGASSLAHESESAIAGKWPHVISDFREEPGPGTILVGLFGRRAHSD